MNREDLFALLFKKYNITFNYFLSFSNNNVYIFKS